MKRTQIYLSEDLQKKLDRLSKSRGSSKSKIIREAVGVYLESESASARKDKLKKGAGLWKDKSEIPDVTLLRKEFDRSH